MMAQMQAHVAYGCWQDSKLQYAELVGHVCCPAWRKLDWSRLAEMQKLAAKQMGLHMPPGPSAGPALRHITGMLLALSSPDSD